MDADRTQWTAIASLLLQIIPQHGPVDADVLARAWRLKLVRRSGAGFELVGNELRYDETSEGEERQRLLKQGLAVWAMRQLLLTTSEPAVYCIVRELTRLGVGRSAEVGSRAGTRGP
jgi:hypothetical protein